jgi:hypothetical protein
MLSKYVLLSGAALCLSNIASAQSSQTCPVGATNCTISVQDAGHNSLNATADNTTTTSSIAGTSSASNQSGNTVAPVFDNSPQTTQNATTTTGAISSASTGNTSENNNASSATNGNQTMGQSNTGTSTNTLGGSSSGGNTLSTGASTSSTGASNAYLGGNTQANGSASSIGATTSNSGGNTLGSDASNSGGNSTTNVDASDRSIYRSKAIFIPPVVPGTPPSQLAVGNIIKETSACGPLQRIVRLQVNGTFIGLFRNASVPQGFSDDIEPYRDDAGNIVDYRTERMADGDVRMFGHQVVMFTTVIGVASNRNIALGGGGGGGSWGQAGMGSSSSNQRLVTNIQLRDCEIGTMHTVFVEVPPKPIRH